MDLNNTSRQEKSFNEVVCKEASFALETSLDKMQENSGLTVQKSQVHNYQEKNDSYEKNEIN